MAQDEVPVVVELVWAQIPELIVEHRDDHIRAVAHAGLSEAQVAHACVELGEVGPKVMDAWRRATGARPPAS